MAVLEDAVRRVELEVDGLRQSIEKHLDIGAARRELAFGSVDNVVGWLGTVGILAALRRRPVEGGSYRVTVSLTRTVLWLLSLGVFDKASARATAGSSDEHADVAPDLFTAETPLGTYLGITEKVLSRTPASFKTVLVPRGSSKPEWLAD